MHTITRTLAAALLALAAVLATASTAAAWPWDQPTAKHNTDLRITSYPWFPKANGNESPTLYHVTYVTNRGGPVTVDTTTPNVCVANGYDVALLTPGQCTVTIDMPADDDYLAGHDEQTFRVR